MFLLYKNKKENIYNRVRQSKYKFQINWSVPDWRTLKTKNSSSRKINLAINNDGSRVTNRSSRESLFALRNLHSFRSPIRARPRGLTESILRARIRNPAMLLYMPRPIWHLNRNKRRTARGTRMRLFRERRGAWFQTSRRLRKAPGALRNVDHELFMSLLPYFGVSKWLAFAGAKRFSKPIQNETKINVFGQSSNKKSIK